MWFFAGVGAVVAGAILLCRELVPYLAARRTGVLIKRGARRERVERSVEPERFEDLMEQRRRALSGPSLVLLGGVAWLAYNFFALWTHQATN